MVVMLNPLTLSFHKYMKKRQEHSQNQVREVLLNNKDIKLRNNSNLMLFYRPIILFPALFQDHSFGKGEFKAGIIVISPNSMFDYFFHS